MVNRIDRGTGAAERQRGHESGAGVVQAVRESAQGLASNAASAAERAWDAASRGAQQAASTAARSVESAWGDLRSCMGRYPFATFFFGVAVGALAAMAVERRWTHTPRS